MLNYVAFIIMDICNSSFSFVELLITSMGFRMLCSQMQFNSNSAFVIW